MNIDLDNVSQEDYENALERQAEHQEDADNTSLTDNEREHAEKMVEFYQTIIDAYNE